MKTISVLCAAVAASAFGVPAQATYYHFEFGYTLREDQCDTQGDCHTYTNDIIGQINTDDAGNGVSDFDPASGSILFSVWPQAFPGDAWFSYDPSELGPINMVVGGVGSVADDCSGRCTILTDELYYLAAYKSDAPTGTIGVTLGTPFSPIPSPPAVPEPASWAMMVGGFGLIGGAMRRRRRVAVRFG